MYSYATPIVRFTRIASPILIAVALFSPVAHSSARANRTDCENIPETQSSNEVVTEVDDDVPHSAQNICYYKRARSIGNLDDCAHAGTLLKRCYFDVAMAKNDPHVCVDAFTRGVQYGAEIKAECLEGYAELKKDPAACKLLGSRADRCISKVKLLLEHDKADSKKKTLRRPRSE